MNRVTDLGGYNKLVSGCDGFFVANENDLYVGRAIIKYGEYSQLEMDLLQQVVAPGNVAVDVGAHTVGLAKRVGPKGRVLAFEPQPVIFQNLCANLSLIGTDTEADSALHCNFLSI